MKIDLQSFYNVYRKNLGEDRPAGKAAGSTFDQLVKTDTDSISRGSTTVSDKQMVALKSNIHSYLTTPVSTQHLLELREKVRAGEYRISTNDLVASILGEDE